ncbi:MAG: hypothetical protein EOP88_22785 [Verrucomicrobiaceae bacterium]|nr:MAG: hypothetical protein EOP88_22785 [Verrucomicrobiaceae bacterium]
MNNSIHVYRQRHIFHGDQHIGKYHVPTRTIRLGTAHAAHGNAVKAHYLRNFGIVTKLLISDEDLPPLVRVVEEEAAETQVSEPVVEKKAGRRSSRPQE